MRPEEYAKNAPGRLIRSLDGYWTFEPDPLPPELSLDLDLFRQLSEADQALGQLAGVGRMLPNPLLLIRPFMRREAVLSSRIEGTVTRLDQLFLFEAGPEEVTHPADVAEVANYVHALELGLEQLRSGKPLTLRLLKNVHARLLQGVRGENKRPGEFRRCGVMLGRPTQSWADARFVPPQHMALDTLLRDLEKFINLNRTLPPIAQMAVTHYQFETIHPFMDGNGRVGRLLISLMMCDRGCLPQPLLYLSAFFEQNDEEYKDRMLAISQRAAWKEWVHFFARGVAEQARDAAGRAQDLLDLREKYRRRVLAIAQSALALELVDELFASPFLTIRRAAEVLKSSFPTANNNMQRLIQAGLVQEMTGQKRNRIFKAGEILRLLDEPSTARGKRRHRSPSEQTIHPTA